MFCMKEFFCTIFLRANIEKFKAQAVNLIMLAKRLHLNWKKKKKKRVCYEEDNSLTAVWFQMVSNLFKVFLFNYGV